jgi:hypothetical protein
MLQQTQSPTTEIHLQSTQNDIPTQTQTSQTSQTMTEIPTTTEAQTPSTFFEAITEFEYAYTYTPQRFRNEWKLLHFYLHSLTLFFRSNHQNEKPLNPFRASPCLIISHNYYRKSY